jgi:hypothetical protein
VRENDVDVSVGFLGLTSDAWVKAFDLALVVVKRAMESDVDLAVGALRPVTDAWTKARVL